MSKNRMVNTKFWSDSFIMEHCGPLERLVFIYLLTNDNTNTIGIYEIPKKKISVETGVDLEKIPEILKKLHPKVFYNEKFNYIFLPNFLKHQKTFNKNLQKSFEISIKFLPKNIKIWVQETGVDPEILNFFEKFKDGVGISESKSEFKYKYKEYNKVEFLNKNSGKKLQKKSNEKSIEIQQVYRFFIKTFRKSPNQYKLTPNRKVIIRRRLKDAGLEMILEAIKNTANNPFYRGENNRNWKADLDFIIRSYEQVERLSNMEDSKHESVRERMARKEREKNVKTS